jgi:pyrroloquinoline quinone biosynthesis protein B
VKAGPVRVRVLGSAAGGGFPQWNCHCGTCEAARAGVRARPRTQSSLAIRGDDGPWFLVNASPDARQQLETLTPRRVDGVRAPPIAGVLLTDAEIDHTAGLLLLRESATPVRVFGDAGVERALTETLLRMLGRFCGVDWHTLEPRRATPLDGSSLVVECFDVGDDQASGFVFRDHASGGVVTYVPGLARLDDDVLSRFAASDLVLVDGTFWRDDELARLGISGRSARDMGHVPLSGPGGTLEALAGLERPRKALVHINNTNPILLEDSPERNEVLRAGVEVAYDGLEVQL